MKRLLCSFGAGLLLLAGAAEAQSQGRPNRSEARDNAPRKLAREGRGVQDYQGGGTVIQYDQGNISSLRQAGSGNLGNLFDTRNGTPFGSATITAFSWYQGDACLNCGQQAGLNRGPQYSASVVFGLPGQTLQAGYYVVVQQNAFNSVQVSSLTAPGTFFAGIFVPISPDEGLTTWGSLGVSSQTSPARGPSAGHGMQRNWTGTQSTSLPSINAVFRATGNLAIPVELLEFELDD